jgi:drug/metabolite transporter (DMT)-like permease
MLFATSIFWGLSFPLGKAAVLAQLATHPHANTMFLAAVLLTWRFGLAALLLMIFCARTLPTMRAPEVVQGCGLGFFAAGGMLLQMDALYFIPASTSAFLTQATCIFVPALVALRRRSLPSMLVIFCCSIVLVGEAILCRLSWRELKLGRGEWETILCALFFAVQILFLQRPGFEKNRSQHVTIVMFGSLAAVLLPVAFRGAHRAREMIDVVSSPLVMTLILGLTLLCTLCTFTIMNHWQKHVTATEASLIYCFEPVFATTFAIFVPGLLSLHPAIQYPNESFGLELVTGGSLIIAANLFLAWRSDGANT